MQEILNSKYVLHNVVVVVFVVKYALQIIIIDVNRLY